ncbi:MAG: hypothetical protein ABEJ31_14605 [Haloarculaceae archaeon]
MQRRAAAVYFVFFLVIGAASYGYIQVVSADQPSVSIDAPKYAKGDTFSVQGRTYNVSDITAQMTEGSPEGGGGGLQRSATLTWTNTSAMATATLKNGSSVAYDGQNWTVIVPNGSNATAFTLRQSVNASQQLASDPAVENDTAQYRGEPWVVWAANSSLREPLAEYLPEPRTRNVSLGETFPYKGNQTNVSDIGSSGVTLTWPSTAAETVDLQEGANATLAGQTYVAHFPNNNTVQLTRDFAAYHQSVQRSEYFDERVNGLWGISIISFIAAIILLGAAYLPVKD